MVANFTYFLLNCWVLFTYSPQEKSLDLYSSIYAYFSFLFLYIFLFPVLHLSSFFSFATSSLSGSPNCTSFHFSKSPFFYPLYERLHFHFLFPCLYSYTDWLSHHFRVIEWVNNLEVEQRKSHLQKKRKMVADAKVRYKRFGKGKVMENELERQNEWLREREEGERKRERRGRENDVVERGEK